MTTYQFRLVGKSPLLMHHDNIEWADQLAAARAQTSKKRNEASKAGDDRTPCETFLGYLYTSGDGAECEVAFPMENLLSGIRSIASRFKVGKQSFKQVAASGLIALDEFGKFYADADAEKAGRTIKVSAIEKMIADARANFPDNPFAALRDGIRTLGFSLYVKRATIGTSKHVRVRPRFSPGWIASGALTVTNPQITRSALADFLEVVGDQCGIGDWRPSAKKPGPYGKFECAELKVV